MHTLLVRVLSRSRRFSLVAFIVIALAAAASAQVFLGAQSTLPGTFTSPTGVATDTAGNIYVVATVPASNIVKIDAVTHATTTYISSGQLINGSALKQDVFISSDAANNLYIADSPNNRIVKWNMTTNSWVADYTTGGGSPAAAAADTSGNVWWVSGNLVLMFDTGSTTSSHQVTSELVPEIRTGS